MGSEIFVLILTPDINCDTLSMSSEYRNDVIKYQMSHNRPEKLGIIQEFFWSSFVDGLDLPPTAFVTIA